MTVSGSQDNSNTAAIAISRDEMNLAEFPLSVLSTRVNPKLKTLEFSDKIKGKNGEIVNREWIITGADKFGLPTSSDDEVLLGLLKLTVNSGFATRKVYFTRYELLKILQWTTEGRSYSRLQNALDRLSGVRIKATNAFYDNDAKTHNTKNFGILDAYEINDGRDAGHKPSFFEWSEVLFKSFQDGFIKKLDLNFFLSLRSAVSKRLYRFLDKHFWYKGTLKFNLFVLAHEKIGVSRNYKYASSIKQQIDPAFEELMEMGFLDSYSYEGRGKHTEVVIKAASKTPRSLEKRQKAAVSKLDSVEDSGGTLLERVQNSLISRGIKEAQLPRLLNGRKGEDFQRMLDIVAHFDRLVRTGSRLVSKSPVGFLYRAIENPQDFVLPGEKKGKTEQTPLFEKKIEESKEDKELKKQYQAWKLSKAKEYRAEIEPSLLSQMTVEAEKSLQSMKGLISEDNFSKALDQKIDEKLLSMFAVPSFEEWKAVVSH